jgi:hypothetical protein
MMFTQRTNERSQRPVQRRCQRLVDGNIQHVNETNQVSTRNCNVTFDMILLWPIITARKQDGYQSLPRPIEVLHFHEGAIPPT